MALRLRVSGLLGIGLFSPGGSARNGSIIGVVRSPVADGNPAARFQSQCIRQITPHHDGTDLGPLPVHIPVVVELAHLLGINPCHHVRSGVDPDRFVPVGGMPGRRLGRDHLRGVADHARLDALPRLACLLDGSHHQVGSVSPHFLIHLPGNLQADGRQAEQGGRPDHGGHHRHGCPAAPPEHRPEEHGQEHTGVGHWCVAVGGPT